jgi:hypothetical protein
MPRRCEMQGRGLRKAGLGTLVLVFELFCPSPVGQCFGHEIVREQLFV